MTLTIQGELPRTAPERLQAELRRSLDRPDLVIDRMTCSPVAHTITAPATASITRVQVLAHDAEPVELRLVAKVLQSARYGLPPQMPEEDRERLAAIIPWRLEWEVYTGDTADRMPPGLRLPRLYGAVEHDDDRITLWLEDADPLDTPWTRDDLVRAATGLGRLTARLLGQELQTRPDTTFVTHLATDAVKRWAIPLVHSAELWGTPAFTQPSVAALRGDLLALADDVDHLLASLSAVPQVNTHGDPTPMNLLRPRSAPAEFVLIDWGTAALGPVGWDVVPLVFGPAENGTVSPDDLVDRLAVAVPAFEAGLRAEGMDVPRGSVAAAVRACALIRYPLTSLPIGEAMAGAATSGASPREDLMTYARRKAAFVRAVLDAFG
jgi:hypothetical protein